MKKLLIGLSTAALLASAPALAADTTTSQHSFKIAQATTTTPDATNPDAAKPGTGDTKTDSGSATGTNSSTTPGTAPSGDTADKAPATDTKAMETRDTAAAAGDGWQASKLMGAKVVNAKNESIGDINDFILSGDGKVQQLIVGVGGFLGLGEHNVALSYSELSIERKDNKIIVVSTQMTKEQLKQLPAWKAPSNRTAPAKNQ